MLQSSAAHPRSLARRVFSLITGERAGPHEGPALLRIGAAFVFTGCALVLTLLMEPILLPAIFLFFYLSVFLSAWYGGRATGVLASVLALIAADFFFFPPRGIFTLHSPAHGLLLAAFLVMTSVVSTLTARLRVKRHLAEVRAREAEDLATELEHQMEESQQLLEELEQSNAYLEELRAEAEHARSEAERANRAKTQFLTVMSHELRTSLNAIIGYADLLHGEISGPLNDRQREQIGRISESAWHLLDLINEILSLSRIEAGKEEIRLEEVDVSALVQDTVALMEPQAARKSLGVRVRVAATPLRIHTDPGKVRQILLNVLSNAVKFTDAGEIEIAAAAESTEKVMIIVRDTGIGIQPNSIPTIFEPFEQIDQSPTRERGGTGLGLPVSRRLAHLLGGDLTVESVLGSGTTFTLHLPARPGSVLVHR